MVVTTSSRIEIRCFQFFKKKSSTYTLEKKSQYHETIQPEFPNSYPDMLPSYVAKGATGSPSFLRRLYRSREKCLIILVAFTLVFICFGGFFYLPDDFGSDRVMKVYKQFQKAGPEIFIPAPPLMGQLGDDAALDTYQRRAVGDRAKLNAKIEQELGRDILEKPDTEPRNDIMNDAGEAAAAEEEVIKDKAGEKTSSDGKDSERWFVDGADKDSFVRTQRDKVKEVSYIDFVVF